MRGSFPEGRQFCERTLEGLIKCSSTTEYLDKTAYRVTIYRTFQAPTQGILLISMVMAKAWLSCILMPQFKNETIGLITRTFKMLRAALN